MQGALHNHADRATGGENGDVCSLAGFCENAVQTSIHACTELLPGFHTLWRDFLIDPPHNHRLKQPLERDAFLPVVPGNLHGILQIADPGVLRAKLREALPEHRVAPKLVECIYDDRFRKRQAGFAIRFAGDLRGLAMALAGARTDAVKNHPALCPIASEMPRLRFPERRKLVVISRKKGSL